MHEPDSHRKRLLQVNAANGDVTQFFHLGFDFL